MTIWKLPIRVTDKQTIMIPGGSNILSAQMQQGGLCLWFRCDPKREKENVTIRVAGTGHPGVNADWTFIDTVQEGGLVWHVFRD